MRLAIQIDEKVYEFYKKLEKEITFPFDTVEGALLVFDTDTQEWTWIELKEAQEMDLQLVYMAPSTLWPDNT